MSVVLPDPTHMPIESMRSHVETIRSMRDYAATIRDLLSGYVASMDVSLANLDRIMAVHDAVKAADANGMLHRAPGSA